MTLPPVPPNPLSPPLPNPKNARQDHIFALMDRLPGGKTLAKYIHGADWHTAQVNFWHKLNQLVDIGRKDINEALKVYPKSAGLQALGEVLTIFGVRCAQGMTYNHKMAKALRGGEVNVSASLAPSSSFPAQTTGPEEESGGASGVSDAGHVNIPAADVVRERIGTPEKHLERAAYWDGVIATAAGEMRSPATSAPRKELLKTLITHGREEIAFHRRMAHLLTMAGA